VASAAKKASAAPAPSPEAIAEAVTEIYRGPAWHGPSVRAALRGVTAAQASWRPAPGRNSIHDLVLHLIYTRHRMIGRLQSVQGGRSERFPRPMRSSSWYPRGPTRLDEATWREDLELLERYQDKALAALAGADVATLALRRRGNARTVGAELMGMAFHDAYHAGQIRMLALMAPRKR
jgi:hypothetical protein